MKYLFKLKSGEEHIEDEINLSAPCLGASVNLTHSHDRMERAAESSYNLCQARDVMCLMVVPEHLLATSVGEQTGMAAVL